MCRVVLMLLLSLLAVLLTGCATTTNSYEGMSANAIFDQGQGALADQRYADAANAYEALEAKYPYSDHAQQEQLNIIYVYYKKGNYPEAQAAAERYIHLNPLANNVVYAYYMRAMSLYANSRGTLLNYFPVNPAERDLTPLKQAFKAFNNVVNQYPHSHYTADSRQHMIYIRNLIADNNLQTADYYYRRQAYVAALARARIVVTQFPHSPSVKTALLTMYLCYVKLNLQDEAKATLRVIQHNYPKLVGSLKLSLPSTKVT